MSPNGGTGMNAKPGPGLETQVRAAARAFTYPETPDIVRGLRQHWAGKPARRPGLPRLAWAITILLVIVAGLFAVPSVRARVLDWIRLGAIRIFLVAPTPVPPAEVPGHAATAATVPTPTPTAIASLLDLAGETSLEDAQQKAGIDLLLPGYPPDLGQPDHVYLQDLGGPAAILVWVDRAHPDQVRLSLFELPPGTSGINKIAPKIVEETQVNGVRALWTEGPHVLQLKGDNMDIRSLVKGNTLIWTANGVTYRLETDQSLEEAVRIAESLK